MCVDNQRHQEFSSSISYTMFSYLNLGKNTLSYKKRGKSGHVKDLFEALIFFEDV